VTARDILYGRQGGRLVPWVPPVSKVAVGDEVFVQPLVPSEEFAPVEVLEVLSLGYVLIRFASGSTVTVDQNRLFTGDKLGDRLSRSA